MSGYGYALNTVTFNDIIDPFCTVYPGKRLIRRCIMDRPHGVKESILQKLQLRHALASTPLSPVATSHAVATGCLAVDGHDMGCTGLGGARDRYRVGTGYGAIRHLIVSHTATPY